MARALDPIAEIARETQSQSMDFDFAVRPGGGYAVILGAADSLFQDATPVLQFFDAMGQADGDPIDLPDWATGIVRLGDSYLIIGPEIDDDGLPGISAQRVSASGELVGQKFLVSDSPDDYLGPPHALTLADGRVVVVWFQEDRQSLMARFVETDGSVGEPVPLVGNDDFIIDNLYLAEGGGFIVEFSRNFGGGFGFQKFDETGEPIGVSETGQREAARADLADGSYVLVTVDDFSVVAQQFNADGTPRTDRFGVDSTSNEFSDVRVTVNADGTYTIAWVELVAGPIGSGKETAVLKTQTFAAFGEDAVATEGDDDLSGSAQDDEIAGLGGDDYIFGLDGDDRIEGGAGDDHLFGGEGADDLIGGLGADQMDGGTGDDRYWVDDVDDVVVEGVGSGFDQIFSTISYVLDSPNIERVVLTGSADINVTGDNGHNRLVGNDGDNLLDGRAGADQMAGGRGDDIYMVGDVRDRVWEFQGEGFDEIRSFVSYGLAGTYVERLVLIGSGNISATGNTQSNRLVGNAGDNTLDGGQGADQMAGGLGDDIYIVDNARDRVYESAGEGFDQIWSSVSYSLAGRYVERLVLTGDADIDATGNTQANRLVGNDGDNVLDGRQGADQMAGGAGDDVYHVDHAGDVVWEFDAMGHDTIISSVDVDLTGVFVEDVHLTGSANLDVRGNSLANGLTGNDGDNLLIGGAGDDALAGGLGADRLDGGTGSDRFVFTSVADSDLEASDVILGLDSVDRIDLSAIDANGLDDGDDAFILVDAFSNERGQATLAYDAAGGRTALLMDIDGDGQADMRIWIEGQVTTLDTSLF